MPLSLICFVKGIAPLSPIVEIDQPLALFLGYLFHQVGMRRVQAQIDYNDFWDALNGPRSNNTRSGTSRNDALNGPRNNNTRSGTSLRRFADPRRVGTDEFGRQVQNGITRWHEDNGTAPQPSPLSSTSVETRGPSNSLQQVSPHLVLIQMRAMMCLQIQR